MHVRSYNTAMWPLLDVFERKIRVLRNDDKPFLIILNSVLLSIHHI